MAEYQGWSLNFLYHVSDRKRLTGTGNTQKSLERDTTLDPFRQRRNRLGLVTRGTERRRYFKIHSLSDLLFRHY